VLKRFGGAMEWLLESKRLANYTTDSVGVTDAFRLAQAAGVSSVVWLIGRPAIPGRVVCLPSCRTHRETS
jgi:hypothetical protein